MGTASRITLLSIIALPTKTLFLKDIVMTNEEYSVCITANYNYYSYTLVDFLREKLLLSFLSSISSYLIISPNSDLFLVLVSNYF